MDQVQSLRRGEAPPRPSRPLVVEVAGPAGTGKTTLIEAVAVRDPLMEIGIHLSRIEMFRSHGANIVRFLPTFARRAGFSWFTDEEARAMAYIDGWHRSLGRMPRRGTLMLDHGPVFRLAFLAQFGSSITKTPEFERWWTASLAKWASALDVVVQLDAPDDVLIHRIRARERKHPVKQGSYAEARRFLARYRGGFDRVVADWSTGSAPLVLRYRTDGCSPVELASELTRALAAACARDG